MKARKLRIHAPAIAYFDKVRRCGSFREAARSLNVASSAVNRQILKLEEELGASLFERLPSGLRLTPAGQQYAHADQSPANKASGARPRNSSPASAPMAS